MIGVNPEAVVGANGGAAFIEVNDTGIAGEVMLGVMSAMGNASFELFAFGEARGGFRGFRTNSMVS